MVIQLHQIRGFNLPDGSRWRVVVVGLDIQRKRWQCRVERLVKGNKWEMQLIDKEYHRIVDDEIYRAKHELWQSLKPEPIQ